MRTLARTLFFVFAILLPILVGALHTYVHYTQLITPEVQSKFAKEILIGGEAQSLWQTWGLISFMMGFSFIIIGLLNGATYSNLTDISFPPASSILITLTFLGGVIYAGLSFEAEPQLYGGIIGFGALTFCLLLTLIGSLFNKKAPVQESVPA